MRTRWLGGLLPILLALSVCATAQAQYNTVPNGEGVTITGYTGTDTVITIPETIGDQPVTAIGDRAFQDKTSLTSITIPNSVTSIGDYAFAYCSSLTNIDVDPANLDFKSIDGVLFDKDVLTVLQYPEGKTASSYSIPNSVTSIGDRAFFNCSSLTSVTLGNSVTSIGDGAFAYCSSLTSITIPNSVTSIADYAFSRCNSLTSITIPNSVTSIGERVFSDCSSLTSITIGSSVTSIGVTAFWDCRSLTNIDVDPANLDFKSIDGVLFDKDVLTVLQYPEGKTASSYSIPNSVNSIGDRAFFNCSSLTSVTLGNSVTSIGDRAFALCSGLTSVTIGSSVTSIADFAFIGCSSLTSVTIGSSVTSIGGDAFIYCNNLTSVYFEGSPPVLEFGAFSFTEVTSYYLPLFTEWPATYGNRPTAPFPFTFGAEGTINSYSGTATQLSIPEQLFGLTVTAIGNDVFADSLLTSLTLPDTVTSIGGGAFQRSASLSSINIPKSLVTLGSYAFFDCSAVTSVSLPNSLTSIGDAVFEGCNQLSNINIPTSLATLGAYAFSGCSSLSGLTFPSTLASIGDGAFESCTSLRSLYFEGAAPTLGGTDVFLDVNNLRVWYLPNSSGWTGSFGGFTPKVWDPQLGTIPQDPDDPQDELQFSITGTDGMACNAEACDDLTAAIWTKQATFTLTGGAASFSDPDWSTQTTRFYRLRMPR